MWGKILAPSSFGPLKTIKTRFGMAVSWKKIKEKVFERQKYYKDYEMRSSAIRIDQEQFKIYISPRTPEIGKDFTWDNRKNIFIGFRDVLQMEKVSVGKPVVITKEQYSTYNNETTKTIKELKIQVIEADQIIKLSLLMLNQSDGDKWLGVYDLTKNDYDFLVQSAKKNIYYASGLKTTIELQKKQIIRQMEKRIINNQEKQLKSKIGSEFDQEDLLRQMEDEQEEPPKPKTKKRTPSEPKHTE